MALASLTYRVVVRAKAPTQRGNRFIWMIVDENSPSIPLRTSDQTFQSMEDAYDAGQRAMGKYLKLAA